jgi:hypothetical protein
MTSITEFMNRWWKDAGENQSAEAPGPPSVFPLHPPPPPRGLPLDPNRVSAVKVQHLTAKAVV